MLHAVTVSNDNRRFHAGLAFRKMGERNCARNRDVGVSFGDNSHVAASNEHFHEYIPNGLSNDFITTCESFDPNGVDRTSGRPVLECLRFGKLAPPEQETD